MTENQLTKRREKDANRLRATLVGLAISAGKQRLGLDHLRVAMLLLGKLDYRKERHIPVSEIVELLGINQKQVSKILTRLRKGPRLLAKPVRGKRDGRKFLRRLRRGAA